MDHTKSLLDKATVAARLSEAIVKYVQGGGDALIAPKDFLVLILGIAEDEANAIITRATTATAAVTSEGEAKKTEDDKQLVIPDGDLPEYWTINEKREFSKLKPIPGGNAIMLPSSLIPAFEFEE